MTNDHRVVRKPPSAFVVLGIGVVLLTIILGVGGFVAEMAMIRHVVSQRAIRFEQVSINALSSRLNKEIEKDRSRLSSNAFRLDVYSLLRIPGTAVNDLFPFQRIWFNSMGGRPPIAFDRFNTKGYYLSGSTLWMKISTSDGPALAAVPLKTLLEFVPSGAGIITVVLGNHDQIILSAPTAPFVGLKVLPQLDRAIIRSNKSGRLLFNTRIGPAFVSYRSLDGTGLTVVMGYPENRALKPFFSIEFLIILIGFISIALISFISLVLWFWYRQWVARMETTAAAIAAGQFELRLPEQGPRELWVAASAANRALEALASARRFHSSLRKAYAALLNGRSEDEILETIVHEVTRVEHAQVVVLFLPDGDRRKLVAHTWFGPAGEYVQRMGSESPVPEINDGGPADRAYTGKQAIVVPETQADSRFPLWKEAAKQYGLLSMVAVPVQVHSDVLGVLSVYDSEPNAFPTHRVARIQQFAEASAFTLLRIRESNRMAYLASTDVLTGLANRRHFETQFPALLAKSIRARQHFCLVIIDLDRFKQLNDTQGHQAGDLCLAEVGADLRAMMRQGDLAVRLGGDEFMLFLLTDAAGCRVAMERILPGLPLGKWGISISGGVAIFPDDGRDYDTLYRRADERMYAAKRAGGNLISFPTIPTVP